MKFIFTVVDRSGVNHGVVDTWDQAVQSLRDWYGDGAAPASLYQIVPFETNISFKPVSALRVAAKAKQSRKED